MNGFDIEIQYSEKVKSTTLEVWPGNLVKVIAPIGSTETELQKIVSKKTKWIIEKQRLIKDVPVWREREFISGESLPILGREYRLKVIEGFGETSLKDDRFVVPVVTIENDDNSEQSKSELVKLSLIKWYKAEALNKIIPRVEFFCEKLNCNAKSISIKDYEARWGSCTPTGDLIFNWQILALPRESFEYVIAHEVCHLIELNHSKDFYRLLCSLGFETDETEARLKYYRNLFSNSI
ncbi:MAG: SprT family zinc-dependent metalloprotease [Bacteriovorax sp.]|nr:SprT family zinc-dependent metalloprotease [Bacteriovorax sp.]